mgnify:CR=1 FL=1
MTKSPEPFLFGRNAVSLNEKAYAALEEFIVTGALAPGSQWSESALAEKIGLGRTPTREALQKLAYQRLVRIAPRQGVFISEIDYQGQLKIIQVRREIEHLVVMQAAQLASVEERNSLRLLADQLSDLKTTKDMRVYMRLHFALTHLLGEASRNVYAAEFYSTLQTLARRFLYFHQDRYTEMAQICDLHIRQIEAVVDGNAEAAVAVSVARNDYAENFAREIVMELIINSEVKISIAPR